METSYLTEGIGWHAEYVALVHEDEKKLDLSAWVSINNQSGTDYEHEKKVNVKLEFMNSEKNGLGLPIPAGTVRVYKSDVDQSQVFLGEDRIDHTPKDEEAVLKYTVLYRW